MVKSGGAQGANGRWSGRGRSGSQRTALARVQGPGGIRYCCTQSLSGASCWGALKGVAVLFWLGELQAPTTHVRHHGDRQSGARNAVLDGGQAALLPHRGHGCPRWCA
ncbi:hypothetical protein GWK47_004394 [Chionoecetes opilio]|uniref:Uncharacterized protein n=1 Tax=Chionoecetes opilio TaxID=41210 RepID=A0A8J4YDY2_CHIOP|nr:hypothetical protein GWK47_004394 [Chionoecetes opilio]